MTRIVDPLDNQEIELQEGEEFINPFDDEVQETVQDTNNSLEQGEESVVEDTDNSLEQEEPAVEDMPEKYKGKSLEEVVRMHQEAEKLVGRQSSEVGELRKAVDDLLKVKLDESKSGKEVEDQEEDFDFYENPKEAVNRSVENSSTIKEMKELLAKQQQAEILKTLESKHPDFMEVAQNENFIEWVKKSQVRTELLQRADKYDLNAAMELLDTWKELKGAVEKVNSISEEDRKLQRKAASTGGRGSSEPVSRKIYRRQDLVNLMRDNPKKYMANIDEYQRAYAEKRVK